MITENQYAILRAFRSFFPPEHALFIDHIRLCLLGYLYDNAGPDDRFSSFVICA